MGADAARWRDVSSRDVLCHAEGEARNVGERGANSGP